MESPSSAAPVAMAPGQHKKLFICQTLPGRDACSMVMITA